VVITVSSFFKNSKPSSVQGGAEIGGDAPTILAALKLNSEHRMLMKYKYGGDTMKTKTFLWACAAVLFTVLLAGCVSTDSSAETGGRRVTLRDKDVSFESEEGTLIVHNNTSKDVIIFVGAISKNKILGGVHAGEGRTFNLGKIKGIPEKGSVLIRAATVERYKNNINLGDEDVIYTGLVVYNLKDKTDKSAIDIYKGVDAEQKTCVYVSNKSKYFVLKLRLGDYSQGPVVATLPPGKNNVPVFLSPRKDRFPYEFYPTYVYADPTTGELSPMNAGPEDRDRAHPKPFGGTDVSRLEFGGPSKPITGYSSAFISLQNDTGSYIEFRNAGDPLVTQKGLFGTEKGRTDVYSIESTDGEAGQTYTALQFEFNNGSLITMSPSKFKPGYKYKVIVTEMNGSYQYSLTETGKKSIVEGASIRLFMEDVE